ncbi:superoxide dismutase [Bacillus sp. AFS053548]|uniref:superoxide dismutase n=1 Tax=Bacillus sp. AFS053548 TaxID=2033505 RepID=UPI000BFCABC9|nr:superoxide dismutase [Bacillus sp. AFS053548]PGM58883.1 superoxide dismutase [Bacillus sp. AFS053548]
MLNQSELVTYFQEVEIWCANVLQLLSERFDHIQEKELLEYKVKLLLNRMGTKGHYVDQNSFLDEISMDVDDIQERLISILNEEEYDDSYAYRVIEVEERVGIGKHELPPLPYPYNALEPYISKEIMMLHHDKHHKSYVDGLNKAELELEKARKNKEYDLLKHWERELAFHGSGHYLHTIFWNNLSKSGGGQPHGVLLKQIEDDFGSYEDFKEHFTQAAKKVEGVGWAILVWVPRANRLEILQTEKHQFFTQWDTIPLLVLDVWEHAYYLQYKFDKDAYITNFWNIVNWPDVNYRYDYASQLKWQPFY